MAWAPAPHQANPFVVSGVPNYVGGRFQERQQLSDWLLSPDRNPCLVAGVRGAGKTTLAAWVDDYLTYDHYGNFTPQHTRWIPVHARGDRNDTILDQVVYSHHRTITTEAGGKLLGASAKRSETVSISGARSLIEALPHGYVIIIDEAQALSSDQLVELADFLERPGSEYSGKVLMAGTPSLLHIHPTKGTLGLFARAPKISLAATQSEPETRDTIIGTLSAAAEHGTSDLKHFTDDAIHRLHTETRGYPTAVQVGAHYAYAAAPGDRVDAEHLDFSPWSPTGRRLIEAFDQMVRRQGTTGRPPVLRQAVIRHLATNPGAKTRHLVEALGKTDPSALNTTLDYLQDTGLVASTDGHWRLDIPLLDRYIDHVIPAPHDNPTSTEPKQ